MRPSQFLKLKSFNPTIKVGPSQDSGTSFVPRQGMKDIKSVTLWLIIALGLIQVPLSQKQVLSEFQVQWILHFLTLNLGFPFICCWPYPNTVAN